MVAASGGILAPAILRIARTAAFKASKLVRAKFADAVARPVNAALEPVLVRNSNAYPKQPIHPAAFLRQQQSRRWHSSSAYQNINAAVRRFISTGRLDASGPSRIDRSKFLNTKTGRAVSQFPGRAPFASTLRPNLTGGTLPRTAGGYGLGSGRVGGTRYFSHAPAAQAQVVQNVSAGIRAFFISGQKAQFDGMTPRGEKRYRSVSALQEQATRKLAAGIPRRAPGSSVDFRLSPTVTALSPLAAAFPYALAGVENSASPATLNAEGFLEVLSVDFARALKDLSSTMADVKKLSSLGDLPIELCNGGQTLRVRFPGVDADTVEALCDDLGLTRGIVREDAEFAGGPDVAVALMFPYAPETPGQEKNLVLSSPGGSLRSEDSFSPADYDDLFEACSDIEEDYNPWLSSPEPEGYHSMPRSPGYDSGEHCSQEFDGLEGIYRFIEACDSARDKF